jgi:hypothetical protein
MLHDMMNYCLCCEAVRKYIHTLCGKKDSFLALQQVVRSLKTVIACAVLFVCEVC